MIAPLLAAALIATPIQTPDHFDLVERSVNIAKPMRGSYSDLIAAAASVPNPWIKFSKCVLDRESGGTLTRKNSGEGAKNPRSSASGRWQFLDSQWRHGGSFMVKDRLVRFGVPKSHARDVREVFAFLVPRILDLYRQELIWKVVDGDVPALQEG